MNATPSRQNNAETEGTVQPYTFKAALVSIALALHRIADALETKEGSGDA